MDGVKKGLGNGGAKQTLLFPHSPFPLFPFPMTSTIHQVVTGPAFDAKEEQAIDTLVKSGVSAYVQKTCEEDRFPRFTMPLTSPWSRLLVNFLCEIIATGIPYVMLACLHDRVSAGWIAVVYGLTQGVIRYVVRSAYGCALSQMIYLSFDRGFGLFVPQNRTAPEWEEIAFLSLLTGVYRLLVPICLMSSTFMNPLRIAVMDLEPFDGTGTFFHVGLVASCFGILQCLNMFISTCWLFNINRGEYARYEAYSYFAKWSYMSPMTPNHLARLYCVAIAIVYACAFFLSGHPLNLELVLTQRFLLQDWRRQWWVVPVALFLATYCVMAVGNYFSSLYWTERNGIAVGAQLGKVEVQHVELTTLLKVRYPWLVLNTNFISLVSKKPWSHANKEMWTEALERLETNVMRLDIRGDCKRYTQYHRIAWNWLHLGCSFALLVSFLIWSGNL